MIDINELRRSLGLAQLEDLSELLDHFEAAEKDIALKEKLIDRLAMELNSISLKHDALRAKIEAMEKQEPVAIVYYKTGSCIRWVEYLGWQKLKDGANLNALPGAKGEVK